MVPPDDRERAGDSFWHRNRDLLAAIASGFVGALALFASIYNVYLQRQQIRAAVWPRIGARQELSDSGYKLFLVNHGVGSGIVRRFRATVDGAPTKSWIEFGHGVSPSGPPQLKDTSDMLVTLGPGGETELFSTDLTGLLRLVEAGQRARVEACYCSSLDDCWTWSANFALDPDRYLSVPNCDPDPTSFRVRTAEERGAFITELRARVAAASKPGTADMADAPPPVRP